MEIRLFGLVLLLVMCAALSAEAQDWQSFKFKHIMFKMAKSECDKVMNKKKIPNSPDGTKNCKEVNSFIVASDKDVIPVCKDAGKPLGNNYYESDNPFTVIKCTGNINQKYPNCEYR
ncbi:ribonuclease-like 3, partial [Clarias magur]